MQCTLKVYDEQRCETKLKFQQYNGCIVPQLQWLSSPVSQKYVGLQVLITTIVGHGVHEGGRR